MTQSDGDSKAHIRQALSKAKADYTAANPLSHWQHHKAAQVLPGGNTRSVLFYDPFPLTFVSSHAARVTSLDGHEYVDFLGEYTAGLYGHSNPQLKAAITQALESGWVMGGHIPAEEELASLICARFPSIERIRFTNSGTEANLYAISTTRALSKKNKVVVFEGGYHGGVFVFGSKASPLTAPFDFVKAPYNDIEGTLALMNQHRDAIGTIIIEPMQGAGGCIPAQHEFLVMLRSWSTEHGAYLIFDEVMTSRLSAGGYQAICGIEPDLTTLGKYIGGGFSFGAFGGRVDIMQHFDPTQPQAFGHAGTFNNNVFTMSVGATGLRDVYTADAAKALNARGDALRDRLNAAVQAAQLPMQFTGLGSMMNVHMTDAPLRSIRDLAQSCELLRELFYFDMLRHGVWLARRGMMNVSLPMTDADGDQLVQAVDGFIQERAPLFSDISVI